MSGSAVVLSRSSYTDFDRLAADVHGFGLDWIQLDRGPLQATVQQLHLPQIMLSRFDFNRRFHQRGAPPQGARTIALLAPDSTPVGWGRHIASNRHLIVFSRVQGYEFVSHPGFCGDTISVSEDTMHAVEELAEASSPLSALPSGQTILAADPGRVEALRQLLAELHGRGSIAPSQLSTDDEFEIMHALLETLPSSGGNASSPPSPRTRRVALRKAVELIEDNADDPPTIADVCRAAGASWRTLNYAFRDQFGVTPKQYLQAVRLRGVRTQLSSPDAPASVSEAATSWGFWNMGRFAAEYRSLFGEFPSETLARRFDCSS